MVRTQAEALLEKLHDAQNAMYSGGDADAVRELPAERVACWLLALDQPAFDRAWRTQPPKST